MAENKHQHLDSNAGDSDYDTLLSSATASSAALSLNTDRLAPRNPDIQNDRLHVERHLQRESGDESTRSEECRSEGISRTDEPLPLDEQLGTPTGPRDAAILEHDRDVQQAMRSVIAASALPSTISPVPSPRRSPANSTPMSSLDYNPSDGQRKSPKPVRRSANNRSDRSQHSDELSLSDVPLGATSHPSSHPPPAAAVRPRPLRRPRRRGNSQRNVDDSLDLEDELEDDIDEVDRGYGVAFMEFERRHRKNLLTMDDFFAMMMSQQKRIVLLEKKNTELEDTVDQLQHDAASKEDLEGVKDEMTSNHDQSASSIDQIKHQVDEEKEHKERQIGELNKNVSKHDSQITGLENKSVLDSQSIEKVASKQKKADSKQKWAAEMLKKGADERNDMRSEVGVLQNVQEGQAAAIVQTQTSVSETNGRVDQLENGVNDVIGRQTDMDGRLTDVDHRVTVVGSSVTTLREDLHEVNAQIPGVLDTQPIGEAPGGHPANHGSDEEDAIAERSQAE